MGQWVEVPRHPPHKCFLTGNSAVEAGPYYEVDRRVCELEEDGYLRDLTVYLSLPAFQMICSESGSPVVLTDADLAMENDDLRKVIATMEANLADTQEFSLANGEHPSADEIAAKVVELFRQTNQHDDPVLSVSFSPEEHEALSEPIKARKPKGKTPPPDAA